MHMLYFIETAESINWKPYASPSRCNTGSMRKLPMGKWQRVSPSCALLAPWIKFELENAVPAFACAEDRCNRGWVSPRPPTPPLLQCMHCQWYPMGDVRTHNSKTDGYRISKCAGNVEHVTRHAWPLTKVKRPKAKVTRSRNVCSSKNNTQRMVVSTINFKLGENF